LPTYNYEFLDFGDAGGYRAHLDEFREQLRKESQADPTTPAA
jgi:hypothetical protein